MKRFILTLAVLAALSPLAQAGMDVSKGKDKVAVATCTEYYRDNEWNISLWGTYAFTGTEYNPNVDAIDLIVSTTEGQTVLGSFDKYIGGDHAWGGGGDFQYFFMRYFGIGVEAFGLNAQKNGFFIDFDEEEGVFVHERTAHERAVGSVLGTFTLRYPVPCTRFAPYAWGGLGVIWGGGESDTLTTHEEEEDRAPNQAEPGGEDEDLAGVRAETRHYGTDSRLHGQIGVGLEYRFTPHISWKNDFAWNILDGPKNNFGMFRSGLNFAF